MIRRRLPGQNMSEPHACADASLRAASLSKHFGGLRAVADVSLDVHTDEIHAVIGPNGAGKSTLINLLSGDMHVSGGSITLDGRDVTRLGAERRAGAGIGRSYQKTTIFAQSSVYENVRLAAQAHSKAPLRMFGSARCRTQPSTAPRTRRWNGPGLRARGCSAGEQAQPRRAAPARDRHGAGDRAAHHPARRAACRHGPAGGAADRRPDRNAAQRPCGAAGRARHGRGVRARRPPDGDAGRPGDRVGPAERRCGPIRPCARPISAITGDAA